MMRSVANVRENQKRLQRLGYADGSEEDEECDLARKRPRLTVSPRYVTLYFTGSFALDAAIVVGGLPRLDECTNLTNFDSPSYYLSIFNFYFNVKSLLPTNAAKSKRGDSADEESKRNSASDGPAKAKRPRCEK
ncbi:hypothetical protein F2Q68_00018027 [Brassica cretica]|uniref:Uncharacterized protein n=1 Tax=Brassica cretica TaxID=69181 RepID=A0A8S9HRH8_BRACR|nr:hypothetical protein F2Q68_00018027 [Brassica cretica]